MGSRKVHAAYRGTDNGVFNRLRRGEGKTKQINHWEDSLLQEPPQCKKKEELLNMFAELRGASNTVTLTMPYEPTFVPMDVPGLQPLGVAAFMDFIPKNPEAKLPQVMQLLHCNLMEREGNVTQEGNDRIWFVTKLADISGSIDVVVPERAALELTGLDRSILKEQRLQATFNSLCFAIFA